MYDRPGARKGSGAVVLLLPKVRPMQIVSAADTAANASACAAMVRSLNRALDGAPIKPSQFAACCAAGDLNPEQTLAALVGVGVLVIIEGRIHLGEVGRIFVTSWYLMV